MFKRSQLTSKKFAKKRKKFFWINISLIIFVILLFFTAIYYLLRLEKITISDISVQGNSAISTLEIITIANLELRGGYYYLFPKKNIFIFPNKKIEERIKDKWKRVDTVNIKRESLSAIKITVSEKTAKFLWCGDVLSIDSEKNQCYFIDKTGYVFSSAPSFSPNVYIRFYGNIEASDPIGQEYLKVSDFEGLTSFIDGLLKADIKVSKLLSFNDGEYAFYLSSGPKILFNNRQDFRKTLGNLETLLNSDEYKDDVKKSATPIDYIDVRFGNKVLYRFK